MLDDRITDDLELEAEDFKHTDIAEIYTELFMELQDGRADPMDPQLDDHQQRGEEDDDEGHELEKSAAAASVEPAPAPPHVDDLTDDEAEAGVGSSNAAAPLPKERKVELKPRQAKVPESVILLPAELGGGELRYNQKGGFIRAHCALHEKCTRQRQVTSGRLGAGRPIGTLVAWLSQAHKFESKEGHVLVPPRSFKKRKSARQKFSGIAGAAEFLGYERLKRDSESDDEPCEIP